MKHLTKKIGIFILFILTLFVGMYTFAVQDIMDVMFQPAKSHEKLLDLGSTKDQVGDEVFRSSQQVDVLNFKSSTQAPLLVRVTKFLLRLTIVLSISMIIYNGIFWIVESSKGGDVKDAKNNLIYIIVGVLLALSSVAIINLISSLGMSSLDPQTVVQTK